MQIISRFYRFLTVCSVLGLHKGFLKFFFGVFVLMDFVTFLKHLILDYELGCGFFMFGVFKQVSKFLGLFLLFGFGMKILYSDGFFKGLIGLSKNGLCSNIVLDGKKTDFLKEKSNPDSDFAENLNSNSVDESFYADDNDDDENEFTEDVSELRNLLKIERHRTNVALAELAKERDASSSAADEAMAMILRLQNEKSSIELESSQYKRLAEEKQIHDQEVIQSLQWLVWKHESERSSLEDQLNLCRRKLKICSKDECKVDDDEDAVSSFNGNILDAIENVFYSSRDVNVVV
ncbi:hypothetical protein PHJA_000829500 [Phtheirospermum japonicum]|uniref:GTD-binding domain-containing protein n=1 Tax=Phtheirospermum japonicum TaxID=374723 RepID=A0A830BHL3_9LAMI|nr:hypothetical protein PHJA_000829500 [Phtheirospermum japonicum]